MTRIASASTSTPSTAGNAPAGDPLAAGVRRRRDWCRATDEEVHPSTRSPIAPTAVSALLRAETGPPA